jgi:hypothetical protein
MQPKWNIRTNLSRVLREDEEEEDIDEHPTEGNQVVRALGDGGHIDDDEDGYEDKDDADCHPAKR